MDTFFHQVLQSESLEPLCLSAPDSYLPSHTSQIPQHLSPKLPLPSSHQPLSLEVFQWPPNWPFLIYS